MFSHCSVQFTGVRGELVVGDDLVCHTGSQLSPVPAEAPTEAEDRDVVTSPEFGSDMLTITSRFAPLRSPVSPASLDGMEQMVVASPTPYNAPVVAFDISSVGEQLEIHNPQESRESPLSSAPLSPNRVSEDFDYGNMDVFPVFVVSPDTDGYLPRISRVSSPGSPVVPTAGSVLDEVTGSFYSTLGSPATSLSIMDHATNLHLLSEPLIPLPGAVFLQADPILLLDLTQSYDDYIPTQVPVASVSQPSAFLTREGPFDASTEPAAISNHPLISAGLTGCPYRMTTYREADLTSVHFHHPRFLECVGAPESARLLGRPPTKWLNVMDRRDAGLMASNLTVLHHNAIALQHMSWDVLHTVFGQEIIPLGVVEEAALVPRVIRASTQMEAMGIWRPPVGLSLCPVASRWTSRLQ